MSINDLKTNCAPPVQIMHGTGLIPIERGYGASVDYSDFWYPHVFYPPNRYGQQHDIVVLIDESCLCAALRVSSIGAITLNAWRRVGVPVPSTLSIERAGVYLRWSLTDAVWTGKGSLQEPKDLLYRVVTAIKRLLGFCRVVGGPRDPIPHPLRVLSNTVELAGSYHLVELLAVMGFPSLIDSRIANVSRWTHAVPLIQVASGLWADADGVLVAKVKQTGDTTTTERKTFTHSQCILGGQTRAHMREHAAVQSLSAMLSDEQWLTIREMQDAGIKGDRHDIGRRLTENGFRKRRRTGRGTVPEWSIPESLIQ